jgi:hypothetical protein
MQIFYMSNLVSLNNNNSISLYLFIDIVWLLLFVTVYYWGSLSTSYDSTILTMGLITIKSNYSKSKNENSVCFCLILINN